MGIIALIALIAGAFYSLYNGNRKLPITILVIGIVLSFGPIARMVAPFGLAGIAILAAVIWIANKADMA